MPSGATATPSVRTRPPSQSFSSLAPGGTIGSPAAAAPKKAVRAAATMLISGASVVRRVRMRVPPSRGGAQRLGQALPLAPEAGAVEHFRVEHAGGPAALGQREHAAAHGPADVAEQLAGVPDAVRGEQDVVELA